MAGQNRLDILVEIEMPVGLHPVTGAPHAQGKSRGDQSKSEVSRSVGLPSRLLAAIGGKGVPAE